MKDYPLKGLEIEARLATKVFNELKPHMTIQELEEDVADYRAELKRSTEERKKAERWEKEAEVTYAKAVIALNEAKEELKHD